MRAFLAGKLDLTRAEAVNAVIEAGDEGELKQALTQLAGGLARPLEGLREDLLNLLADVEAALDFADEDIQFVARDDILHRLTHGMAQLTTARRQLEQRSMTERPFRVVLAGRPNAGKSSLFNALGGGALVSAEAGTTRDYLIHQVDLGDATVEIVDTPGWQTGKDNIEEQAQTLGREQTGRADLVLLCIPTNEPMTPAESDLQLQQQPPVLSVATKCDLRARRRKCRASAPSAEKDWPRCAKGWPNACGHAVNAPDAKPQPLSRSHRRLPRLPPASTCGRSV